MRKTLLLSAVFATVIGCSKQNTTEEWSLKENDTLPSFHITMNSGQTLTEENFKDRGVIVFFNTMCPDCRKELPTLQQLYSEHPDLNICLISREQEQKPIEDYWKTNELTLPFSAQKDRTVFEKFASSVIPRTYAVKNKVIIKAWDDTQLPQKEEILKELL